MRKNRVILAAEEPRNLAMICAPCAVVLEAGSAEGGVKKLPKFSMDAYTGASMRVAYWDRPVVLDMSGYIEAPSIVALRNHDWDAGVGHMTSAKVIGGILKITGIVSRATDAAREVVESGNNGFPWQASVGLDSENFKYELVNEGKARTINGREFTGPFYHVTSWQLAESSFVAKGADGKATSKIAAQAAAGNKGKDEKPSNKYFFVGENQMEFNVWLKANGIDLEKAKPNEAEMATLKAKWEAEVKAEADKAAALKAQEKTAAEKLRAEIAAEETRIMTVRKLTAKASELTAKAVEEGWDATRTELEVLRASRPNVQTHSASGGAMPDGLVIEAAAALTGGLPMPEKHYKPETLDAAHRIYGGRMHLQEMLLMAAAARGYSGRWSIGDGNLGEVLGYALPYKRGMARDTVKAAFSTVDIDGILSNVANKFLTRGYNYSEQSWRRIATIQSVKDFKTSTFYTLNADLMYEKVGPGGKIPHGTMEEESYTNRIETYAKMLAVTRQDIINDDLGAFTQVPMKLGIGAGQALNHVFWTIFLDNAAFFTGARTNLNTGAGSAFGFAGLTAAESALIMMAGPDGRPIGLVSKYLALIPPALKQAALQLFKAEKIDNPAATVPYADANTLQGQFEPVISAYLQHLSYGNSSVVWYLVADPQASGRGVIDIAFLDGRQEPTLATAEADFDTLGIQMRGYHDLGCALSDWRAGNRNNGA